VIFTGKIKKHKRRKEIVMKARFENFSLKRILSVLFLTAASILLLSLNAKAQCSELLSGLRDPLGTALTNQGNLLVSENGIYSIVHSGRISIVDPVNGNRRTLLDGLPSAINESNEQSGNHGLVMLGRTLYVAMGVGDVGLPGPIPGATTIPNPNPASPMFSSVIAINFSANVENTTTGFHLTTANQQELANEQTVNLTDGGGNNITIEMLANFPDYVPFPIPIFQANIQTSNPYHMILLANELYVTDGARNLTWKVNINSGLYSEFVSFPDIPNPVFPTFGGPTIQSVPTGIAFASNRIYISLFRGFPFAAGTSTVQIVDPQTGNNSVVIPGLRTAIGILPLKETGDTKFLVLQHTSGEIIIPPFTEPGLLLLFKSPTSSTLLADCLVKPASMTLDRITNKLYVSERGGRVVVLDMTPYIAKPGNSKQKDVSGKLSNDFVLGNNYPNPFNPVTKLEFAISNLGFVSLKVSSGTSTTARPPGRPRWRCSRRARTS
jgi:hypothetical protein